MSTPKNKFIVNSASGGGPQIHEVPYPTLPRDDYMIVKVRAVAVQPTDPFHADLEGEHSVSGCYAGCDYAGEVMEVGAGVTKDFVKGDRVAGFGNGANFLRKTDGAFGYYTAVKGDLQFKIPDHMSNEDAATQGVAISTMGQSLYRDLKLPLPNNPSKEPFPIFIYGGSTAMGIAGIQLAKLSGATVITTSSPANFSYLRSLGADHVFDYRSPTLVADVTAAAGGRNAIRHALDTKSIRFSAEVCARVLSPEPGSRYSALLWDVDGFVKDINPGAETLATMAYTATGEEWYYFGRRDAVPEDYVFARDFVIVAEALLQEGKLKAPRVFLNRGGSGLKGVLQGFHECRDGKVSAGKLVYTIDPDTDE